MKKFPFRFRSAICLLLALAAMFGLCTTAHAADADSKVNFDGQRLTVLAPTGSYTSGDLFNSFKNIMPGDHLSEVICVENQAKDFDYIKVYLRIERPNAETNPLSEAVLEEVLSDKRIEGALKRWDQNTVVGGYMDRFLSQVELDLWNGDTLIYNDQPHQEGTLAEDVCLGAIRPGECIDLRAELTVPIEMENRFMDRIGEIPWVFTIEGFDDPTPPEEDKTMLTVRKVWADNGVDRPESIAVQLLRNGKVHEEITLNQSNQWTYTWDGLERFAEWRVLEANVPEGYVASYTTEGSTTTITNTAKELVPDDPKPPIDFTVVKKWSDGGKGHPDSVKVTLYNAGTAVESVWLGSWNQWTYTWHDLDGSGAWQVLETSIPKGFTPSYSQNGNVVTIVNTATLIQTGQLSWPIPVLGGLGLLLLAFGVYTIARKRRHG